MKRTMLITLVLIFVFSCSVLAAPSSWAIDEVNKAVDMGIVPGTIMRDYQDAIKRDEFCEMVVLMYTCLGGATISGATDVFDDTDNESVMKAYKAGIVKGVSDTAFAPDKEITRQEMCVMLTRAIKAAKQGINIPSSYANFFPDEQSIAPWAVNEVKYLNLREIILGDENGNINPVGNATREQAVLLAYRTVYNIKITAENNSLVSMFMSSSGNTASNMMSGSFAVQTDEGLYVSPGDKVILKGNDGVEQTVIPEGAKQTDIMSNGIYFISSTDGKIYKQTDGGKTLLVNEKAGAFCVRGDEIYFSNTNDGNKLYKSSNGVISKVSDKGCEMPINYGSSLYYSDGNGIYEVKNGTENVVYSGVCKNVLQKSGKFYFLENGKLNCFAPASGEKTELSTVLFKNFGLSDNCAVGVADDGIYKVSLGPSFSIRIKEGVYSAVNTYADTVFAKSSASIIESFGIYGGDVTVIK